MISWSFQHHFKLWSWEEMKFFDKHNNTTNFFQHKSRSVSYYSRWHFGFGTAFVWWLCQAHSDLQSQFWKTWEFVMRCSLGRKSRIALSQSARRWIALGRDFRSLPRSWTIFPLLWGDMQNSLPTHLLLGHSSSQWVTGAWMPPRNQVKCAVCADVVEITQTHCDTWITSRHPLGWGLCTIGVTALFLPARDPQRSGAFHSKIFPLRYFYMPSCFLSLALKSTAAGTGHSSARLCCMANGLNLCWKGQVREDYGLVYCWMADLISTNVPPRSVLSLCYRGSRTWVAQRWCEIRPEVISSAGQHSVCTLWWPSRVSGGLLLLWNKTANSKVIRHGFVRYGRRVMEPKW